MHSRHADQHVKSCHSVKAQHLYKNVLQTSLVTAVMGKYHQARCKICPKRDQAYLSSEGPCFFIQAMPLGHNVVQPLQLGHLLFLSVSLPFLLYLSSEGPCFFVQARPFCHNAACPLQLGLLCQGVVAKVYGLGILLGCVATPGLTPQPFLHQSYGTALPDFAACPFDFAARDQWFPAIDLLLKAQCYLIFLLRYLS